MGSNCMAVHQEALYADLFPPDEDAIAPLSCRVQKLKAAKPGDRLKAKGRKDEDKDKEDKLKSGSHEKQANPTPPPLKKRSRRRQSNNQTFKDKDLSDFYDSLIEEKSRVMEKVDASLAESATDSQRRKQTLHREWNDNVFNRIKEVIDDEMTSHHARAKEEKRRMYESYLRNYNNKHGNVFLDVITKTEYNPLCKEGTSIRYHVELEDDPLQRGIFINKDEQLMRSSGESKEGAKTNGYHTLSAPKWLAIPMYDIDSFAHTHGRPSRRVNQIYNHSEIKQDPLIEMPLGKKHFEHTQQEETADFELKVFEALPHAVKPKPSKFNR